MCHTSTPSHPVTFIVSQWTMLHISHVAFHRGSHSRKSTSALPEMGASQERNCQKGQLTLVKYLHRTEPWPARAERNRRRTAVVTALFWFLFVVLLLFVCLFKLLKLKILSVLQASLQGDSSLFRVKGPIVMSLVPVDLVSSLKKTNKQTNGFSIQFIDTMAAEINVL